MEKTPAFTVESFIDNWNGNFPNCQLKPADLTKPKMFMGALIHIFERLGIDEDTIMQAPPEDETNKHVIYYRDLIPVINVTRIFNRLFSVVPQVGHLGISPFLQPTITSSHSILLLLLNLMLFNEERLQDIAPYEEELFSKSDEVKALEDKKNRLVEMLNAQALEKGKRLETIQKLETGVKQLEEELKQEKECHDKEKQEYDALVSENKQNKILLEQKKEQRDRLMAEVEKKRAQRVYDADSVQAQAAQAAQSAQEVEEELKSLRASLMKKEECLKNLQAIKPNLDMANNLLDEITKLSEAMKDDDPNELDIDTADRELEVINTEISQLEVQLAELRKVRADAAEKRRENEAKRQEERIVMEMNLDAAEKKERKNSERVKKATQQIEEIKQRTFEYEQERLQGIEEISRIKDMFTSALKSEEDILTNQAMEVKRNIEEKIQIYPVYNKYKRTQ